MIDTQLKADKAALISVSLLFLASSVRISSECDGRGCEFHSDPAQVVHCAAAAEERSRTGLQGESNSQTFITFMLT